MDESLLDHYRAFGPFTDPGLYGERLRSDLPGDVPELGRLVKRQIIHKITLQRARRGDPVGPAYGDIAAVPWYRQGEDDYFPTAAAMLAELYRREPHGFVAERAQDRKLILTCRFVAILTASILKSKGVPARVRAGYAPYIHAGTPIEDHWITQYWHDGRGGWVTIDADTSLQEEHPFDPFDMPDGAFDFAAAAWLAARSGRREAADYRFYGKSARFDLAGQVVADLHCLMHNEIPYTHVARLVASGGFDEPADERKLEEIDALARLMLEPDEHFAALRTAWETNRDLRLLRGPLT